MVKSTSNEENSFHLKQKKKKVIELAICQISAHNDSSVATHWERILEFLRTHESHRAP